MKIQDGLLFKIFNNYKSLVFYHYYTHDTPITHIFFSSQSGFQYNPAIIKQDNISDREIFIREAKSLFEE